MNDERRRLLLARETWRSMYPSEMEVLRAAKRIAGKIQPRRGFSLGRRVRMVSGALATIAGIAYAGSGSWGDLKGHFLRGVGGRQATEEPATAAAAAAGAPRGTPLPHEPKEGRSGVVPEHLAVDAAAPITEMSPKPAKKKVARNVPRVRKATAAAGAAGTVGATGVLGADGTEIVPSGDRLDPTWADINAALGTLDYRRAETLLLQLADPSHDADTRAKAHLGLAQLAAARGDCERARVLALNVAAAPGIEMKTVRRALELAVRCAR
jgi:hypothetical protein